VADDGSYQVFFSGSVSLQFGEVLEKLKSASSLISVAIKDELSGSKDKDVLERLYCAKGGVICAIEETEKYFDGEH
jgi:hypothetical protein